MLVIWVMQDVWIGVMVTHLAFLHMDPYFVQKPSLWLAGYVQVL